MGPDDENDLLEYAFQIVAPGATPHLLAHSHGFGSEHEARRMCARLRLAFSAVGMYNHARNPDHVIAERWSAEHEELYEGVWGVFIRVSKAEG